MSYKKRPELVDVIRRRGVSLEQWCQEFQCKSWEDIVKVCAQQDVIPPARDTVIFAVPAKKEELKAVLDEVHDSAERVSRQEPQTCTRGIHDGPCNGYPAPDCQVFDDETGGTVRCADFEAKTGKSFKEFVADEIRTVDASLKPTKRSKPVKLPKKVEDE